MASPRFTERTEPQGMICFGDPFSDLLAPTDIETASIARIVVTHSNSYITSLTVYYAGSTGLGGVRHGEPVGTECNIVLSQGEIITSIEGSVMSRYGIGSLKFVTNKRSYGPFGQVFSPQFVWKAPSWQTKCMEFLYFTGTVDNRMVRSLKGNFAEVITSDPASILKFENIPAATSPEQSARLSRFARNLVSPQVILSIGPNNIEFHVLSDILCRLPYFRAALTGGFREAVDKRIVIPGDSPNAMAALIEFLYHGVYTYTYTSATTTDTPPSDLAHGEFQVAVYAVADRYGCQALADEAVRNFMYVLERLSELDCLMLYKVAYENDLPMAKWGIKDAKKEFVANLARQLGVLYRDHAEEVEDVFKQYPTLATDFLRLVITRADIS